MRVKTLGQLILIELRSLITNGKVSSYECPELLTLLEHSFWKMAKIWSTKAKGQNWNKKDAKRSHISIASCPFTGYFVGDGFCDLGINISECSYDNGDCIGNTFTVQTTPGHQYGYTEELCKSSYRIGSSNQLFSIAAKRWRWERFM